MKNSIYSIYIYVYTYIYIYIYHIYISVAVGSVRKKLLFSILIFGDIFSHSKSITVIISMTVCV